MPYRIAQHTEASVVCVVHMFYGQILQCVFLPVGQEGWVHLRLLATCDVAVATRDVG